MGGDALGLVPINPLRYGGSRDFTSQLRARK